MLRWGNLRTPYLTWFVLMQHAPWHLFRGQSLLLKGVHDALFQYTLVFCDSCHNTHKCNMYRLYACSCPTYCTSKWSGIKPESYYDFTLCVKSQRFAYRDVVPIEKWYYFKNILAILVLNEIFLTISDGHVSTQPKMASISWRGFTSAICFDSVKVRI